MTTTDKLNGFKSSNEIVLIRGLSGSGKTTKARAMTGYRHLEADMFLEVDGKYVYNNLKVNAAHDWCVNQAKEALEQGFNVVISNTFVKIWELQRYINFGFPFRIIEMKGNYKNIHAVPKDKIELMKKAWQELPENLKVTT